MPEDRKTILLKRPFDGNVPLTCRASPARAARFAVDLLLPMDEASARSFGSDGGQVWSLM